MPYDPTFGVPARYGRAAQPADDAKEPDVARPTVVSPVATAAPQPPTSIMTPEEVEPGTFSIMGRPMPRETIMQLDGGKQLLDIVDKSKQGRRGFGEAFTDIGMADVPLVGDVVGIAQPIRVMARIPGILKKMENQEEVSPQELVDVQLYLADAERRSQSTTGGLVGDLARSMPGFMAEFAAAQAVGSVIPGVGNVAAAVGSAASLGRRLVARGVRSALGEATEKRVANVIARTMAGRAAERVGREMIAQTPRMVLGGAGMTFADTAINSLWNTATGEDALQSRGALEREIGGAISGDEVTPEEAQMMALGDRAIEYISEFSGPVLFTPVISEALGAAKIATRGVMRGMGGSWLDAPGAEKNFGSFLKAVGEHARGTAKEAQDKMVKFAKAADPKDKFPIAAGRRIAQMLVDNDITPEAAYKMLTKGGYDWWLEELGEERFGGFIRGLTGLSGDDEGGLKNAMREMWPDNVEQAKAEAIAFAIPMALPAILHRAQMSPWLTGGNGYGKARERLEMLTKSWQAKPKGVLETYDGKIVTAPEAEGESSIEAGTTAAVELADAERRAGDLQPNWAQKIMYGVLKGAGAVMTGNYDSLQFSTADILLQQRGVAPMVGIINQIRDSALSMMTEEERKSDAGQQKATDAAKDYVRQVLSAARETAAIGSDALTTLTDKVKTESGLDLAPDEVLKYAEQQGWVTRTPLNAHRNIVALTGAEGRAAAKAENERTAALDKVSRELLAKFNIQNGVVNLDNIAGVPTKGAVLARLGHLAFDAEALKQVVDNPVSSAGVALASFIPGLPLTDRNAFKKVQQYARALLKANNDLATQGLVRLGADEATGKGGAVFIKAGQDAAGNFKLQSLNSAGDAFLKENSLSPSQATTLAALKQQFGDENVQEIATPKQIILAPKTSMKTKDPVRAALFAGREYWADYDRALAAVEAGGETSESLDKSALQFLKAAGVKPQHDGSWSWSLGGLNDDSSIVYTLGSNIYNLAEELMEQRARHVASAHGDGNVSVSMPAIYKFRDQVKELVASRKDSKYSELLKFLSAKDTIDEFPMKALGASILGLQHLRTKFKVPFATTLAEDFSTEMRQLPTFAPFLRQAQQLLGIQSATQSAPDIAATIFEYFGDPAVGEQYLKDVREQLSRGPTKAATEEEGEEKKPAAETQPETQTSDEGEVTTTETVVDTGTEEPEPVAPAVETEVEYRARLSELTKAELKELPEYRALKGWSKARTNAAIVDRLVESQFKKGYSLYTDLTLDPEATRWPGVKAFVQQTMREQDRDNPEAIATQMARMFKDRQYTKALVEQLDRRVKAAEEGTPPEQVPIPEDADLPQAQQEEQTSSQQDGTEEPGDVEGDADTASGQEYDSEQREFAAFVRSPPITRLGELLKYLVRGVPITQILSDALSRDGMAEVFGSAANFEEYATKTVIEESNQAKEALAEAQALADRSDDQAEASRSLAQAKAEVWNARTRALLFSALRNTVAYEDALTLYRKFSESQLGNLGALEVSGYPGQTINRVRAYQPVTTDSGRVLGDMRNTLFQFLIKSPLEQQQRVHEILTNLVNMLSKLHPVKLKDQAALAKTPPAELEAYWRSMMPRLVTALDSMVGDAPLWEALFNPDIAPAGSRERQELEHVIEDTKKLMDRWLSLSPENRNETNLANVAAILFKAGKAGQAEGRSSLERAVNGILHETRPALTMKTPSGKSISARGYPSVISENLKAAGITLLQAVTIRYRFSDENGVAQSVLRDSSDMSPEDIIAVAEASFKPSATALLQAESGEDATQRAAGRDILAGGMLVPIAMGEKKKVLFAVIPRSDFEKFGLDPKTMTGRQALDHVLGPVHKAAYENLAFEHQSAALKRIGMFSVGMLRLMAGHIPVTAQGNVRLVVLKGEHFNGQMYVSPDGWTALNAARGMAFSHGNKGHIIDSRKSVIGKAKWNVETTLPLMPGQESPIEAARAQANAQVEGLPVFGVTDEGAMKMIGAASIVKEMTLTLGGKQVEAKVIEFNLMDGYGETTNLESSSRPHIESIPSPGFNDIAAISPAASKAMGDIKQWFQSITGPYARWIGQNLKTLLPGKMHRGEESLGKYVELGGSPHLYGWRKTLVPTVASMITKALKLQSPHVYAQVMPSGGVYDPKKSRTPGRYDPNAESWIQGARNTFLNPSQLTADGLIAADSLSNVDAPWYRSVHYHVRSTWAEKDLKPAFLEQFQTGTPAYAQAQRLLGFWDSNVAPTHDLVLEIFELMLGSQDPNTRSAARNLVGYLLADADGKAPGQEISFEDLYMDGKLDRLAFMKPGQPNNNWPKTTTIKGSPTIVHRTPGGEQSHVYARASGNVTPDRKGNFLVLDPYTLHTLGADFDGDKSHKTLWVPPSVMSAPTAAEQAAAKDEATFKTFLGKVYAELGRRYVVATKAALASRSQEQHNFAVDPGEYDSEKLISDPSKTVKDTFGKRPLPAGVPSTVDHWLKMQSDARASVGGRAAGVTSARQAQHMHEVGVTWKDPITIRLGREDLTFYRDPTIAADAQLRSDRLVRMEWTTLVNIIIDAIKEPDRLLTLGLQRSTVGLLNAMLDGTIFTSAEEVRKLVLRFADWVNNSPVARAYIRLQSNYGSGLPLFDREAVARATGAWNNQAYGRREPGAPRDPRRLNMEEYWLLTQSLGRTTAPVNPANVALAADIKSVMRLHRLGVRYAMADRALNSMHASGIKDATDAYPLVALARSVDSFTAPDARSPIIVGNTRHPLVTTAEERLNILRDTVYPATQTPMSHPTFLGLLRDESGEFPRTASKDEINTVGNKAALTTMLAALSRSIPEGVFNQIVAGEGVNEQAPTRREIAARTYAILKPVIESAKRAGRGEPRKGDPAVGANPWLLDLMPQTRAGRIELVNRVSSDDVSPDDRVRLKQGFDALAKLGPVNYGGVAVPNGTVLQAIFVLHSVLAYEEGAGTASGNYFDLLPPDYLVDLDRMAQEELQDPGLFAAYGWAVPLQEVWTTYSDKLLLPPQWLPAGVLAVTPAPQVQAQPAAQPAPAAPVVVNEIPADVQSFEAPGALPGLWVTVTRGADGWTARKAKEVAKITDAQALTYYRKRGVRNVVRPTAAVPAAAPVVTQAHQATATPASAVAVEPDRTFSPTTFGEALQVLESQSTILSNSEARILADKLKLRPNEPMPRVLVASERTDPVWYAERVKNLVASGKFDAVYLITKHDGLPIRSLLQLPIPKLIHFSMTTLGGTAWEPGVMRWQDLMSRISDFVKQGLDPADVTIRIDPIVPGVTSMAEVREVIKQAAQLGITRIRFSVMDGYSGPIEARVRSLAPQVLSEHYNRVNGRMEAKQDVIDSISAQVLEMAKAEGIPEVGSCAERVTVPGIRKEGCLPPQAVANLVGHDVDDSKSAQRALCLCFGGKVDGFAYTDKCPSSCVYCYAKHGSDVANQYYNPDGTLKDNPLTRTLPANAPVATAPATPAATRQAAMARAETYPVIEAPNANDPAAWDAVAIRLRKVQEDFERILIDNEADEGDHWNGHDKTARLYIAAFDDYVEFERVDDSVVKIVGDLDRVLKPVMKALPATGLPGEDEQSRRNRWDDAVGMGEFTWLGGLIDAAVAEINVMFPGYREAVRLRAAGQRELMLGAPAMAAQEQAPAPQAPTINVWFSSGENAILSNLAPREFTFDGRQYWSVEHAYQSLKSGSFDKATYDKYTRAAGVKIPGTKGTKTENKWNIQLMETLLRESFRQNFEAARALKATEGSRITHNQDTGVWRTAFPRLLEKIRAEYADTTFSEEAPVPQVPAVAAEAQAPVTPAAQAPLPVTSAWSETANFKDNVWPYVSADKHPYLHRALRNWEFNNLGAEFDSLSDFLGDVLSGLFEQIPENPDAFGIKSKPYTKAYDAEVARLVAVIQKEADAVLSAYPRTAAPAPSPAVAAEAQAPVTPAAQASTAAIPPGVNTFQVRGVDGRLVTVAKDATRGWEATNADNITAPLSERDVLTYWRRRVEGPSASLLPDTAAPTTATPVLASQRAEKERYLPAYIRLFSELDEMPQLALVHARNTRDRDKKVTVWLGRDRGGWRVTRVLEEDGVTEGATGLRDFRDTEDLADFLVATIDDVVTLPNTTIARLAAEARKERDVEAARTAWHTQVSELRARVEPLGLDPAKRIQNPTTVYRATAAYLRQKGAVGAASFLDTVLYLDAMDATRSWLPGRVTVHWDQRTVHNRGIAAAATATVGAVDVYTDALSSTNWGAEVLLHELLHVITLRKHTDDPVFRGKIAEMLGRARKAADTAGYRGRRYGLSSTHEFMSEAFANREFQKFLASVPGLTSTAQAPTSLWSDFVAALRAFVQRVTGTTNTSMLDEVINTVLSAVTTGDVEIAQQKAHEKRGRTSAPRSAEAAPGEHDIQASIVPTETLISESQRLAQDAVERLKRRGFSDDDTPDVPAPDYADVAETVEEWKQANGIKYNPQEAYDRGEGFFHDLGAFNPVSMQLFSRLAKTLLTQSRNLRRGDVKWWQDPQDQVVVSGYTGTLGTPGRQEDLVQQAVAADAFGFRTPTVTWWRKRKDGTWEVLEGATPGLSLAEAEAELLDMALPGSSDLAGYTWRRTTQQPPLPSGAVRPSRGGLRLVIRPHSSDVMWAAVGDVYSGTVRTHKDTYSYDNFVWGGSWYQAQPEAGVFWDEMYSKDGESIPKAQYAAAWSNHQKAHAELTDVQPKAPLADKLPLLANSISAAIAGRRPENYNELGVRLRLGNFYIEDTADQTMRNIPMPDSWDDPNREGIRYYKNEEGQWVLESLPEFLPEENQFDPGGEMIISEKEVRARWREVVAPTNIPTELRRFNEHLKKAFIAVHGTLDPTAPYGAGITRPAPEAQASLLSDTAALAAAAALAVSTPQRVEAGTPPGQVQYVAPAMRTEDPAFLRAFNTPLSAEDEQAFMSWLATGVPGLRRDLFTYDLRGYWKNAMNDGTDQALADLDRFAQRQAHAPDMWKKPNHPTFSEESIYSKGQWRGGTWLDETTFQPSPEMLSTTHPRQEYLDYMSRNLPEVTVRMPGEQPVPQGRTETPEVGASLVVDTVGADGLATLKRNLLAQIPDDARRYLEALPPITSVEQLDRIARGVPHLVAWDEDTGSSVLEANNGMPYDRRTAEDYLFGDEKYGAVSQYLVEKWKQDSGVTYTISDLADNRLFHNVGAFNPRAEQLVGDALAAVERGEPVAVSAYPSKQPLLSGVGRKTDIFLELRPSRSNVLWAASRDVRSGMVLTGAPATVLGGASADVSVRPVGTQFAVQLRVETQHSWAAWDDPEGSSTERIEVAVFPTEPEARREAARWSDRIAKRVLPKYPPLHMLKYLVPSLRGLTTTGRRGEDRAEVAVRLASGEYTPHGVRASAAPAAAAPREVGASLVPGILDEDVAPLVSSLVKALRAAGYSIAPSPDDHRRIFDMVLKLADVPPADDASIATFVRGAARELAYHFAADLRALVPDNYDMTQAVLAAFAEVAPEIPRATQGALARIKRFVRGAVLTMSRWLSDPGTGKAPLERMISAAVRRVLLDSNYSDIAVRGPRPGEIRVTTEGALRSNALAMPVLKAFSDVFGLSGYGLVGSPAYARWYTVYRAPENQLHDLDIELMRHADDALAAVQPVVDLLQSRGYRALLTSQPWADGLLGLSVSDASGANTLSVDVFNPKPSETRRVIDTPIIAGQPVPIANIRTGLAAKLAWARPKDISDRKALQLAGAAPGAPATVAPREVGASLLSDLTDALYADAKRAHPVSKYHQGQHMRLYKNHINRIVRPEFTQAEADLALASLARVRPMLAAEFERILLAYGPIPKRPTPAQRKAAATVNPMTPVKDPEVQTILEAEQARLNDAADQAQVSRGTVNHPPESPVAPTIEDIASAPTAEEAADLAVERYARSIYPSKPVLPAALDSELKSRVRRIVGKAPRTTALAFNDYLATYDNNDLPQAIKSGMHAWASRNLEQGLSTTKMAHGSIYNGEDWSAWLQMQPWATSGRLGVQRRLVEEYAWMGSIETRMAIFVNYWTQYLGLQDLEGDGVLLKLVEQEFPKGSLTTGFDAKDKEQTQRMLRPLLFNVRKAAVFTPEERELLKLWSHAVLMLRESVDPARMDQSSEAAMRAALNNQQGAAVYLPVAVDAANANQLLGELLPAKLAQRLIATRESIAKRVQKDVLEGKPLNAAHPIVQQKYKVRLYEALRDAGLAVYKTSKEGVPTGESHVTIPLKWIEEAFLDSEAYKKIIDSGRKKELVNMPAMASKLAEMFDYFYSEVNKHDPQIGFTSDNGALGRQDLYIPHRFGMGFLGSKEAEMRATLRKAVDDVSKAKAEEYRKVLEVSVSKNGMPRPLGDVSDKMWKYLFDLKGLAYASREDSLKQVMNGSLRDSHGLHPEMTYADIAKVIHNEVENRLMQRAVRNEKLDDEIKLTDAVITNPLDFLAYLKQGLTGFRSREFSRHTLERRFNTYREAYEKAGLTPANLGFLQALHDYTANVSSVVKRKNMLVQMIMARDYDGTPLFLVDPTIETPGTVAIFPDDVLEMHTNMLAEYYSIPVDTSKPVRERLHKVVEAISANKNKPYARVDSPYPSIQNFYARREPKAEANVLDMMVGGEAAGILKHVLDMKVEDAWGIIEKLEHTNQWMKMAALQGSAFFAMSGLESIIAAQAAMARTPKELLNFGPSFIQLRRMIKADHPYLREVIDLAERRGVQMSRSVQTYDQNVGIIRQDIEKIVDYISAHWSMEAGRRARQFLTLPLANTEVMFGTIFNTAKLWMVMRFLDRGRQEALEKGVPFDPDVALSPWVDFINKSLGGDNPNQYSYFTPGFRQVVNLSLFSWGWTKAALDIAGAGVLLSGILKNGVEPHELNAIVKNWAGMAVGVLWLIPFLTQLGIYILAGNPDDDDHPFIWDNEADRRFHVDVTPILRNLPGYAGEPTGDRRFYIRWGKQSYEVLNGWLKDARKTALGKMSQLARMTFELATGESAGSEWDLGFKNQGLAGLIVDKDGDFKGSVLGHIAQKIMPFSILAWARTPDAGMLHLIAPVSKGTSYHTATTAYYQILKTWANTDTYTKLYQDPKLRANLENLGADVLDAAARNGYEPKEVLKAARGAVFKELYAEFYKALEANDQDAVERVSRKLMRVNGSIDGVLRSIRNRDRMYGEVGPRTPEQLAAITAAFDRP